VQKTRRTACASNSQVELVTLVNDTHVVFPQTDRSGETGTMVNTTAIMWEFLQRARPTTASSVACDDPPSAGGSDDDTGGSEHWRLVGGIVGGCLVLILVLILWLGGVFAKCGCRSPCAKEAAPAEVVVAEARAGAEEKV